MSIFDTVRDSVAAIGVSQKVSYATSTMKLNSMIKNKERDIDMITCAIGRDYVNRHLDETGGEFDTQLQAIRDMKEEINQYWQQLDQLKAEQEEARVRVQEDRQAREEERSAKEKVCRQQAYTEFQAQTAYESPDSPKVAAFQTGAKAGRFCTCCGGANDSDSKFCIHCGKPL